MRVDFDEIDFFYESGFDELVSTEGERNPN